MVYSVEKNVVNVKMAPDVTTSPVYVPEDATTVGKARNVT